MNGIKKFFEDLRTVDEPVNEGREVADAALSNGGAEDIITALKEAYAEEVEAYYQYNIVKNFIRGNERSALEDVIGDNASDELDDHSQLLLSRIDELGGNIDTIDDFNELSVIITPGHEFIVPKRPYKVASIIKDNIRGEKNAIATYKALAELALGYKDYKTYDMAKDILGDEEAHLNALENLLCDVL